MEIEMKFVCDSLEQIKENAVKKGFFFIKEQHHIDTYFLVGHKNKEGTRDYLRIRENKKNGKSSLDYHIVKSDFATKEYETEISNKETIVEILTHFGYKPLCVVEKRREVYSKNGIIITFDEVTNLGKFIEIELEGEDSKENWQILEDLAKGVGLNNEKRILRKGYPDMILELNL